MATTKEFFKFNDITYKNGTKLKFTGTIEKCPNIFITLNNEEVVFLYSRIDNYERFSVWKTYLKYKNETYWCKESDFMKGILSIGINTKAHNDMQASKNNKVVSKDNNLTKKESKTYIAEYEPEQPTEIIWDDWMVAKTLWYIVIMLFATIFNDRIGIWILATVIWWNTTIKNAPRA